MFGNLLAFLLVRPAVLLWADRGVAWVRGTSLRRALEAGLIALGPIAIGSVSVVTGVNTPAEAQVLLFALVPFLLWAAVRFGPIGAASFLLAGAMTTIPMASLDAVLPLRLSLLIVAVPVILLAATIADRGKAEQSLRVSEERYREVVERQTQREITDRKRVEDAHWTLAHAQRLAVVGELTASIAHEINQPLNAMFNNAEAAEMLLELERPRIDEVRQILADIRRQDLMASQVVRRMRTLLARHELEMSGLDLNETIAEALHLIAADALRRGIVLDSELARPLPPVQGDRVHLQQVLLNLAVNGMDAMAGVPDVRRRLIVRTVHTDDGFVDVAVSDSGHGIGADRQARLFESFYTTKKDGMGLGLSIARSIVQAHHGRIWAENNAAGGATFHFALPARASEWSISTSARP